MGRQAIMRPWNSPLHQARIPEVARLRLGPPAGLTQKHSGSALNQGRWGLERLELGIRMPLQLLMVAVV